VSKQPEALWLADLLDGDPNSKAQHDEAAAELRRLYAEIERLRDAGVGYSQQTMDAVVREREKLREANAELLEALKRVKESRVFIGAIAQGMMDNAIARAAPEVQP
jgi:hypothetical protein